MATAQGLVFLSPNKTLQLTYEGEFYEVLIPLGATPGRELALIRPNKRKEVEHRPQPSPISGKGQTSGGVSPSKSTFPMPQIVTTVKDSWTGQEVKEGVTQLV